MGNQKQKWTAEEEEALLAGIAKHGPGKWKNILKDPVFAPFLTSCSNIDLKDKWRNLSVNTAAQGSKDKARNPKVKALIPAPAANFQNGTPATPVRQSAASNISIDDATQKAQDVKNAPRYNRMVFEALSTIKDTNGSDINTIVSFIEKRHEVPPNFRWALSMRLRRLVAQGKLEKIISLLQYIGNFSSGYLSFLKRVTGVQNCYRIKRDSPSGAKVLPVKQKDIWQHQPPASSLVPPYESSKDAADTAAYRLAEAENKSFLAAEAVKEAERLAKFAGEADAVLQLVKEIYEQCWRGETIVLA